MKKVFAILLAVAMMATMSVTAFAAEPETETITVHMTDYGWDGWEHEGSRCYVVALSEPYTGDYFDPDESIVIAECTFDTGDEETATFTIEKMQVVYFYWVKGPYSEEAGFTIYRNGTEVYRHVSEADEGEWNCVLEDGELFFTSTHVEFTTVSFNVDPAYTVTIPATVELDKTTAQNGTVTYEKDYTITADDVRLKKGECIEVAVASDFEMTAGGATLAYTITAGGNAVANNGVVAQFVTTAEEQTATIHIAANDPEFAGEYKDTITFTVAVKDAPKPLISFTIDGTSYQAEEGMTWGDWVNSEYDNDEFSVEINAIKKGSLFVSNGGSNIVYTNNQITANAAYVLGSLIENM